MAFLKQLEGNRLSESNRPASPTDEKPLSTLQQVIKSVTDQNTLEKDVCRLTDIVDSPNPKDAWRAFRRFKFEGMQRKWELLRKDANLRSGGRGLAARKELVRFEKELAAAEDKLGVLDEDISPKSVQEETQEASELLAKLQLQFAPMDKIVLADKAKRFLLGLGFTEARMEKPLSSLSGGWKMRASLAASLLQDADILILDEPTNFLDIFGIIWLQKHLALLRETPTPPTVLLISHDRDFTDICTDLILLKDKTLTYFHGTLANYEAAQSERRLWLVTMKAAQDKQKAHMEKTIAHNLKAGKEKNDLNKIRQAKSRQLRLDDRWGMQVNARGGKVKVSRDVASDSRSRDEIVVPPEERPLLITLPLPPELRFPGSLISLENASYKYAARGPVIIQNVTLTVGLGDRIGLLGLNGAGKSTLIRMLVGEAQPTHGNFAMHPRLKLAYYAQDAVKGLRSLADADGSLTALALLQKEAGEALSEGEVRGLLGSLGLPGRLASDVPLAKLSGGQLVRCELARLLWPCPNCLVLDEVTTHLDCETVTALRDALRSWPGAVVLISHDRWFMRGVVEGQLDEGEEEMQDDGSDDDSSGSIVRSVYKLDKGELTLLKAGVDQFEGLVERRMAKLL